MPDKKLTDVTDNKFGEMSDSEIVKERKVSLKEQIEHYNKRQKEVFDKYYRRNTDGSEDTLEICVLRESAVLISKLESIINRLQVENKKNENIIRLADKTIETANAEIERLKNCVKSEDEVRDIAKRTMEPLVKEITREQIDIAVKLAKAEAYKEFAEELKIRLGYRGIIRNPEFADLIDNLLKELVGDGK